MQRHVVRPAPPTDARVWNVPDAIGVEVEPRPSVLLISDSMDPSGVGAHMLSLSTALKCRLDFRIVFARVDTAVPWFRGAMRAGIRAIALAPSELISGSAALVRLLRSLSPDIVHVHAGIAWEGHGCTHAACEAGIRTVLRTEHLPYTLRPLRDPELEASYASNAVQAEKIICVSEAARATFRMSTVHASRYRTIHNGISPLPPKRPRNATRASLGLWEEPLIITVARLTEQKQHAILLHAMPRVLRAIPNAHLLIVGGGILEESLKELAAALELTHCVHFLGRRSDIADLLAAADVFCLPSHFEGHPLALLEAMMAGLPVVATRSLGITEAVTNGDTGILVPTNEPLALAAALTRILTDKALANRLGQSGKQVASTKFSVERMAKRTLSLYRECLRERFRPFND